MRNGKTRTSLHVALVLAACLCAANSALAQNESVRRMYALSANIPTNLPGEFAFSDPPLNFDALNASDEELARYGFPPRPEKTTERARYEVWAKSMKSAKFHWKGDLKVTDLRHSPADLIHVSQAAPQTGPVLEYSTNWSGFVNANTLKEWNASTSFAQIVSVFDVPAVHEPFGVCSGDPYVTSIWNGIDGFGGNDVLQGGVSGVRLQ